MDIYDAASDAALAYQGHAPMPVPTRELTQSELDRLVSHLVATEMPIPDALRALRLDIMQITIDDLDRLATQIARCRHCNTWTRLAELVDQACPDCRAEMDEEG